MSSTSQPFGGNKYEYLLTATFSSSVLQVVCQPKRTAMLQTPKIIFFGPVGSGKETLAKMFKEKYKISTGEDSFVRV